MIKICTVVGARPQFIKASALSREIRSGNHFEEVIVHTGQHFDKNMSDIFFSQMNIPVPKYNLGIGGGSHGENTGRMIESLEKVFKKEAPQLLVNYGDTDTTLASSIAASKINLPIAHIEAGLRSYNREMPEEINRVLTDHCSNYLFCPSDVSVQNLKKEGIQQRYIFQIGDIMYDNFLHFRKSALKPEELKNHQLGDFVLCTLHRQENTERKDRFIEIVKLLNSLSYMFKIIIPLHPRTKNVLRQNREIRLSNNIILTQPFNMFETFWALKNASFVITDSGGVQKEAFWANKKCVTLRDETEWVELVKQKVNMLIPPLSQNKEKSILKFLKSNPSFACSPYGNGRSAEKILQTLRHLLEPKQI